MNWFEKLKIAAVENPEWGEIPHGAPVVLYAHHGQGRGGALHPQAEAALGRSSLLGPGFYFAPTKRLAEPFGEVGLYKVSLQNPFVIPSANFTSMKKLNPDAIKAAGHDGIIILNGQSGFGVGQESLRQGVAFYPEKSVQRIQKLPPMSTLSRGARVRILPAKPAANGWVNPSRPEAGAEGVVTSFSLGHPNVKIKGKVHFMNKDEVEVIPPGAV